MNLLTKEIKSTILYIVVAFFFSVLMCLLWVYQFSGHEPLVLNINSDYYYVEGSRNIISGVTQNNNFFQMNSTDFQLTAFFVRILHFSFENVIFYVSVLLNFLIVILIISIAKILKNLNMEFIVVLFNSIICSYYNRTIYEYKILISICAKFMYMNAYDWPRVEFGKLILKTKLRKNNYD